MNELGEENIPSADAWQTNRVIAERARAQREKKTMTENRIARKIVDASIQIHRELGPGLLETVYEVTLAHALRQEGLRIDRQVPVAISFRGTTFDEGFRADIMVEDKVIVELKCVEKLNNAHRKQLLTYLRLTDMKLGLLLNFSEAVMKDGIVRIVNGLSE